MLSDKDSGLEEIIDEEVSVGSEENEGAVEGVSNSPNLENAAWYIVQTLSNKEYRVLTRIQMLIAEKKYSDNLFRALVPEQQSIEIKNNIRHERKVKIYPGYVFVQMLIEDDLAYEIRGIPGVAKFIGTGNKPTPVQEEEILRVLRKIGDTTKQIEVDFSIGESIKVISGPFRGYSGTISEINALKANIKAKISIFGRETPVELDFDQVEKME
jgi:transcriptional antiterminator NusG